MKFKVTQNFKKNLELIKEGSLQEKVDSLVEFNEVIGTKFTEDP